MELTLGVTDLAEFVHRIGDIDDRDTFTTQPQEGIQNQKKYQNLQKRQIETYQREVKVSYAYQLEDLTLNIKGRLDGLFVRNELSGELTVIEEIKTTRTPTDQIKLASSSAHSAQLKLYAAMWSVNNELDEIEGLLTYIHPDTGKSNSTSFTFDKEELMRYLSSTCESYASWVNQVRQRVGNRNEKSKTQSFPYDKYNEDQQRLARHSYVSLRDSDSLLFEAPTGSGKSMTVAFPAVKAIGEGQIDRGVFCTARTTGQQAANDAFAKLREQNDDLVAVTLSAKERVCLTPGAACRPEECNYAKGHYDRIRSATENLLHRRLVTRNAIDTIARNFKVCPFELSLDAAEWADFIVCDYNYVFDPLVQYSRIQTALFKRVGLLVDEAHRLTDRVRESLSCEFDLNQLDQLATAELPKAVAGCLDVLLTMFSDSLDLYLGESGEVMVDSVTDEIPQQVQLLVEIVDNPVFANQLTKEVKDALFVFYRFLTIWAIQEEAPEKFAWNLWRQGDQATVSLKCLLADHYIRQVFANFHGSVRFSGTLSPGYLYNEEHGLEGDGLQARISDRSDRLAVFVVPDLSTFYKDRQRTAADLALLLEDIRIQAEGNWLIAFPSFQYMSLVLEHLSEQARVLVQQRNSSLEEREEFINSLSIKGQVLAFVVMGGVFTESVDIEHSALEGVIVVSAGIPPRSAELDRIQALSTSGYEIAYRKPAMVRVVQAAGRVFRNETDRGVVLLIDSRFTRADFKRYFPSHWSPKVVKSDEVVEAINAFNA